MSNKVPVTRLEAFLALKSIGLIGGAKALKLSKSESFRALKFSILFIIYEPLKFIGQILGFLEPPNLI